MTTPVSQLLVRIAADTGALVRGGKKSERALDGIGRRADAATKKMAALSVAAAAAAGAAFFTMTKQAIDATDAMAKTAKAIGVTAEEYQELAFAAGRAGIGQEMFTQSMLAFTKRLGEAQQGTGEARAALEQLGISLSAIEAASPADALEVIADKLELVQNPLQRNAILSDLFSRAGIRMGEMLVRGARDIDDMRQKARDLGIVISNEMAAKAEVASDELGDMGEVLRVAGLNIALEFMPVMRQLADLFTSEEFIAGIRSTSAALGETIAWMRDNTETVERFAAAFAGITIGARFGGVGALAGGIAGAAFGPRAFDAMGADDDHALSLAEGGIDIGEPEQLQEKLDERAAMWTSHLDTLAQVTTQANATAESSELAHQTKLTEIAKKGAKDRADADKQEMFGKLNATASFFGDLASLAEAAGDDAFKQQKMLAIAAALIGSIESAVHAFNWGSKIGGPLLGAAFAAAATAAQVARVAQIKAVQPGGGGTASGGGSFSAPATPAQAANSQQTLLVQGIDANSLWRGDNVRDLAERLIEFQENGGRVVVQ